MDRNRIKKISLTVMAALLIPAYQNCSGFHALDSGLFGQASLGTGDDDVQTADHPRLFVTPLKLAKIKSQLPSNSTLQLYLSRLTAAADAYAKSSPPVYFIASGATTGILIMPQASVTSAGFTSYIAKDSSGVALVPKAGYYQVTSGGIDENMLRDIGTAIQDLVAAAVFTGDSKYVAAVDQWASAVASYNDWDERFTLAAGEVTPYQPDFTTHAILSGQVPLLASASLLSSLSLAYDWCNDTLPASTLAKLETSLVYHARLVSLTAGPKITGVLNSGIDWWQYDYMQNHNEVGWAGLAVAASALKPKYPDLAGQWLTQVLTNFKNVKAMLSADGATPEGVSYGAYLMTNTYDANAILKKEIGANLFVDTNGALDPFWQNFGDYYIYHIMPKNGWTKNSVLQGYGDVVGLPWYGPNTLFRKVASLAKNTAWQDFADQLDTVSGANSRSTNWEGLIAHDPDVASTTYSAKLPLFKLFATYGEAASRSAWSDSATSILYRSGPHSGGQIPYAQMGSATFSSGHIAPAEGAIAIASNGLELLRTSSYVYQKLTKSQNTLVFDCDSGQSVCNGDNQIGQLSETTDYGGMPLKFTVLTPSQICTYDPAAYLALLQQTSAQYPGSLTVPTSTASLCTQAVVTTQAPALCAAHSDTKSLCQKTPTIASVAPTSSWNLKAGESVDYVVMDVTAAYDPAATSMKKFERHAIYLRSHNALLVLNDVELNASKTMNFYYHTIAAPTATTGLPAGQYLFTANNSTSSFKTYVFDSQATASSVAPLSVGTEIYTMQTITMKTVGSSWSEKVAFVWAPPSGTTAVAPETVTYQARSGGVDEFVLTSNTGAVTTVDVDSATRTVQIR